MTNRASLALALILSSLVLALSCGFGSKDQAPPPAPVAQPKQVQKKEPAPAAPQETERSRALTADARLLAGLPAGDEPWATIEASPAWKAHAHALGALWKTHETARLAKVRRWSDSALKEVRSGHDTVFYPFGGPDALYATALFPEAPSYVLVGLEPVGSAPDIEKLTPEQRAKSFKNMETYITPILQISFFRTDDMEEELAEKGTLPILMTFLAGTGHRILDVQKLALHPDGTAETAVLAENARGARITFLREGAATPQTLDYFSQDLSNAALQKAPEFTAMLGRLARPLTFLKAASYLLYRDHFTAVRTFILDKTSAILEDDSGIPLKDFDRGRWDVALYGTYTKPIHRFRSFAQSDLASAYAKPGAAKALDFGIGYMHHAGESNLLLAVRKP